MERQKNYTQFWEVNYKDKDSVGYEEFEWKLYTTEMVLLNWKPLFFHKQWGDRLLKFGLGYYMGNWVT